MNTPHKVFLKEIRTITSEVSAKKKTFQATTRKTKLKLFVLLLVTFFVTLALSVWRNYEVPLVSPLTNLTSFRFLNQPNSQTEQKVVYGFLPYWNIQEVALPKELTHLGYFSLTIDAQGNFIESYPDGELDMGLRKLNSETFLDLGNAMIESDRHIEIVITQFNHGDIAAFLASPTAQENFFSSLDNVLLAYPINGVNIDFETSGVTDETMRNNMSEFMKNLRAHLQNKYSNVALSIDVYAGAAQNKQLWDIAKIAPHVDYIVVMAYDFHRSSSQTAGPVAPLFGNAAAWESGISDYFEAFIAQAPREKILLGVPFYGYEWQTTSRESKSHTFPGTGSAAPYTRVLELLEKKEELKVQEHWNEQALSPYLSYVEDGEIYVVYYENSRSLSYKLDFVNQLDLGGIAIWALGYEGESRELWDVVERKMSVK